MKKKQLEFCVIIFGLIISFFLGRETKNIHIEDSNDSQKTEVYKYNSLTTDNLSTFNTSLTIFEESNDSVYRCGKSKIYHPTLSHASFKNCKSKITKLTVKKAQNIGMRHCKCSK